MPADQPFTPLLGRTVSITAVSTSASGSQTLTSTGFSNSILVNNTANVVLFVRLDKSATTLASSVDIPMQGLTSRLFANPAPNGAAVVSVAATLNGSASSGLVIFTPGMGGVV